VRLLGAAHVRNEADIVEAFVRHNLVLLDGIAIVDHASVDATPDILRVLKDEGLIHFRWHLPDRGTGRLSSLAFQAVNSHFQHPGAEDAAATAAAARGLADIAD